MAMATTLETLSPKQLGKHLREVRRRKGLSLSEVARGAGLTRRELNAYEKGRVPIPDSDLFVLAGSCGVDVAELRVVTTRAELAEAQDVGTALVPAIGPQPVPSTIEDTVAQLRRGLDAPAPSVPEKSRRRRPRALGAADAATEEPTLPAQSAWPVERIDPFDAVQWPGDEAISSPSTTMPHAPAEPIDVFKELARLAEPLPSTDPGADGMFVQPQDLTPPTDAVNHADAQSFDEWPAFESDYDEDAFDQADSETELVEMPQNAGADLTSAADAPPIDVAMRGELFNSPWDSLRSSEALSMPVDAESVAEAADDWDYEPANVSSEQVFDGDAWEPASPSSNGNTQWFDETPAVANPDTDPTAFDVHVDDEWTTNGVELVEPVDEVEPIDTATETSVSQIFDPRFTGAPAESAPGSWAHAPDPQATSSGFYIDWGEPEDDGVASNGSAASAWDLPTAASETEHEFGYEFEAQAETAAETFAPWSLPTELQALTEDDAFEPEATAEEANEADLVTSEPADTFAPIESESFEAIDDELPVISWRPPSFDAATQPEAFPLTAADVSAAELPEPEPEPEETFVAAGAEWVLGNAVPLVEVRSTGSLVMRRADERWALADVIATSDFALEVHVDLRSGPGFGVLFRAELDDEGRMSGYSFDVDPVYEGGGYLVREWRADRELWNPIAHVSAPDAGAMHGLMAVRLTVDDDNLVASVNGDTVLTVDGLKLASVERGREGVAGDRVGVQAWSSTDLVIDELRVAQH